MNGFYKIEQNGYVSTRSTEKEGYLPIEKDSEGNITTPIELVNQISKQLLPSKQEQLNSLIVSISNNKRFYADPESRTDLMAVVIEAQRVNAANDYTIEWKTPDGIITVTLADLKEASALALTEKAKIIGVVA